MIQTNAALRFGPPPTHYGGLDSVIFVETAKLKAVGRLIRLVTSSHQAGLIYGDAGLGKTTAVRYVLSMILKVAFGEVTFSDSPNRRENVNTLHHAILGRPGIGTAANIEADLRRAVLAKDIVLVVDEVESINIKRLTALRKLQDVPGARLSVIYIGDTNADKQLREDLRLADRLLTGVQFKAMNLAAVVKHLPTYHALYADTPRRTIRSLNENVFHGSWRAIAKFTVCAEFLIEDDVELGEASLRNPDLVAKTKRLFWNGA